MTVLGWAIPACVGVSLTLGRWLPRFVRTSSGHVRRPAAVRLSLARPMWRRWAAAMFASIAVLVCGCGSGAPTSATLRSGVEMQLTLRGVVVNGAAAGAGGPLAAATVEAFEFDPATAVHSTGEQPIGHAQTDASGHFVLSCAPPAGRAIDVRIRHPQHAAMFAVAPVVGLPGELDVGSVVLPPRVDITLRLHDLDETPLAGLLVHAELLSADHAPTTDPMDAARHAAPTPGAMPTGALRFVVGPRHSGWTDARGESTLVGCAGRWAVRWGGGASSSQFEVPGDEREFARALLARGIDPAALIDGQVVDADAGDAPIGFVSLLLHARDREHALTTDAAGGFSLPLRTTDAGLDFSIALSPAFEMRFQLDDVDQTITSGDRAVRIALRRRAVVTTRMRLAQLPGIGPEDSSMRAAWVRETAAGVPLEGMAPTLEPVRIDADGLITLPAAPRDALAVWLVSSGPVDRRQSTRLAILRGTPNDAHVIEVALGPPRPHVVRVVDAATGVGIPGIEVWLQHGKADDAQLAPPTDLAAMVELGRVIAPVCVTRAVTDDRGDATLEVPPDVAPLVLGARGPTIAPSFEPFRASLAADAQPTRLPLVRHAAVHGRVTPHAALAAFVAHEHPRALPSDARIVVTPLGERGHSARRLSAPLDDSGHFAFDALPIEPWSVSIELDLRGPSAGRSTSPRFELGEWRDLEAGIVHQRDLDIRPLTPGDVGGSVRCDGELLNAGPTAAIVVLTDPNGRAFSADVDHDGEFVHDDVPAGSYRVLVVFEHAGQVFRHVRIEPIEVIAWRRLALDLELRSRPLRLRALDAAGRPLAHVRLRAELAEPPSDDAARLLRALHVERPPLSFDANGEFELLFPPEVPFVLVEATSSEQPRRFEPILDVRSGDLPPSVELRAIERAIDRAPR